MTKAVGTIGAKNALEPLTIQRRKVGPEDIYITIDYCGICHSDLHMAENDWQNTTYPIVPGHEIIGRVEQVGSAVKNFKVGDWAGVGCMVNSCQNCENCKADKEQFCLNDGTIFTYNSPEAEMNQMTYGGYSQNIVVNEKFVLKLDPKLDKAAAAPLLCAGITTYSPLRKAGVKPGQKVGIMGLGGLGHIAIKLAVAMGAHVTVITHSVHKVTMAKELGAHDVLLSSDQDAMQKAAYSFDFLLNTIPVKINLDPYINLLKTEKTMAIVGISGTNLEFQSGALVPNGRSLTGSLIGGIKETQEMLDFCAQHNIVCDIELIKPDYINEAYDRLKKSQVRYRFVMDNRQLGV